MPESIYLRYQCPRCESQNQADDVGINSQLTCTQGDWSRVTSSEDFVDGTPCRCLVCGTEDLWKQKDFPQVLGMAMVGIGAIGSSILWYYHRPVGALAVLLAVAAIDFLLFAIMPDVLVCYRCSARHSGGDISGHAVFDHETAERYRQEQIRLQNPQAREG